MNTPAKFCFTYTRDAHKITVECDGDVDANEFVERVQEFMLAVGYTAKTVDEALGLDGGG